MLCYESRKNANSTIKIEKNVFFKKENVRIRTLHKYSTLKSKVLRYLKIILANILFTLFGGKNALTNPTKEKNDEHLMERLKLHYAAVRHCVCCC